jgi:hypothetical protein
MTSLNPTIVKTDSNINSYADLPILKHFDASSLSNKVDTFRKGEKNLFWFLKLAVIIGVGAGLWIYVLPQLFIMLGQLAAAVACVGICAFLVIARKPIFAWMRRLARKIHEAAITYDPFAQLEIEKQKMLNNQDVFRKSKGNIIALQQDMVNEAKVSEDKATELQNNILRLKTKVEKIKSDMDAMVANSGEAAKSEDDYVSLNSDLFKKLSESQRVGQQLAQSKDFVTKYGSRAAIMKKFVQKLTMVETSMEIKIADFDATIEILKNDFKFGNKMRTATDAAKGAMGLGAGWELDYALNVVTDTIANDIAITSGNIRDIDALASGYSIDSDDLYANLETLADNINVGKSSVPSAKAYNNPEYKLTQNDKAKSGGFGNIEF